jgi:hypothetical protein
VLVDNVKVAPPGLYFSLFPHREQLLTIIDCRFLSTTSSAALLGARFCGQAASVTLRLRLTCFGSLQQLQQEKAKPTLACSHKNGANGYNFDR